MSRTDNPGAQWQVLLRGRSGEGTLVEPPGWPREGSRKCGLPNLQTLSLGLATLGTRPTDTALWGVAGSCR